MSLPHRDNTRPVFCARSAQYVPPRKHSVSANAGAGESGPLPIRGDAGRAAVLPTAARPMFRHPSGPPAGLHHESSGFRESRSSKNWRHCGSMAPPRPGSGDGAPESGQVLFPRTCNHPGLNTLEFQQVLPLRQDRTRSPSADPAQQTSADPKALETVALVATCPARPELKCRRRPRTNISPVTMARLFPELCGKPREKLESRPLPCPNCFWGGARGETRTRTPCGGGF